MLRTSANIAQTSCRILFAAVSVASWILPVEAASAQAQLVNGAGRLGVMTYNVYEGTDFTQLAKAKNLTQLLGAVGQTIAQVGATDPPGRMQQLAKEILAAGPTLVSLQELDQWYSGPVDPATLSCGPLSLEFDMLQELLNALGPAYQLVYQAPQYQLPTVPGVIASTGTFLCVAARNYIAVLARADLAPSVLQLSNVQSAQYQNETIFKTPVGSFPEPHAWIAVDVNFNGEAFRFIGTHLESSDANVRQAQGGELRAGPANTSLPVIIAMDSNAQAAPPPQDPTYTDFLAAGYADAWTQVLPQQTGFTCCQAELVNNRFSRLSRRIDLILTSGNLEATKIARYGAAAADKTPSGLWPSDHAGVAARIIAAMP
jgi:endonuclease/exonuclease/phosphatase family metal-dependent hydrolase